MSPKSGLDIINATKESTPKARVSLNISVVVVDEGPLQRCRVDSGWHSEVEIIRPLLV